MGRSMGRSMGASRAIRVATSPASRARSPTPRVGDPRALFFRSDPRARRQSRADRTAPGALRGEI
eukprot:25834-Pelagococcus_subviridis.AAC.2